MMDIVILTVVLLAISWLYAAIRSWTVRSRSLQRLYWQDDEHRPVDVTVPVTARGWLTRWLSLAGFRHSSAAALFVMSVAGSIGAGLVAGLLYRALLLDALVDGVSNIPGGIGEVLAATLQGGPWILLLLSALAPTLVVRSARRRLVKEVERDLPLTLELLATMAEAGLGFDAAISKIVESQPADRPLVSELINFQADMRAGVPRLQALRQVGRRVDVISLTAFTSAIIQAEHVGASMAETLRHQADDVRSRRREHALLMAQALPVKLVVPLVVCFLPGIFVSTLAPVIYQMIQVADSVTRSAGR